MGADPATDRLNARKTETLKDLCLLFMERHVKPKRKSRTAEYYQQIIDTHIIPALGSKQAIQINRLDVANA